MRSGKYTGAINPHNDLSRNLVKQSRMNQPSLRTIGKWREEWIEKGLDKKMTFQSYKKGKCKEYHRQRYIKKKNLTLKKTP
jgi:hypothetical protein